MVLTPGSPPSRDRWGNRLGVLAAVASILGFGAPLEAQRFAAVRGTVFDSVGRGPIAGALVQFVGTSDGARGLTFAARSDNEGLYRLDSLPTGAYLAGFFHEAADSLGVESSPRRVTLRAGEQEVDLGVPSPASLIRAVCRTEEGGTLLLGHVRDAVTESAVADASAWVEWIETVFDRTGVHSRERADTVKAKSSGFFSMCGLPGDVQLLARVGRGVDSTGYVEVEVPQGGVRHVTFYLGGERVVVAPAALPDSAAPDSAAPAPVMLRGRSRLTGRVRDADGDAVAGARAVLLGAALEGIANSEGAFSMDSLPSGSYTLEIRAIGFVPVRRTVQLIETRPVSIEMSLGSRIFTLPTQIVRGELVYSRALEGFDRRRRTNFTGRFMSPRDIQARPRTRLSNLLQGMQGVEVTSRGGYSLVVMRVFPPVTGIEFCGPSLYVNGTRDLLGEFDRYWSDEIAGIEVYTRASFRPVEFLDSNECGAVAVWMRPRPSDIRD
jgi:hypothetical protein